VKEITVTPWCDGTHPERVRATHERTLTIDGRKPRVVDLCDEDNERLQRLYDEGAPAEQTRRRSVAASGAAPAATNQAVDGGFPCDHCPRSFPTSQGRATHTTRSHPEVRQEAAS
jgi:hypothetical protein